MLIAAALSFTPWTVAPPVGGRAAGLLEASQLRLISGVSCDLQAVINLHKKCDSQVELLDS
jgi:hypothetical protein